MLTGSLGERGVVTEAVRFHASAFVVAAGLAITARRETSTRVAERIFVIKVRAVRRTAGGTVMIRWESRSRRRFVTHGGAAELETDIFQCQQ